MASYERCSGERVFLCGGAECGGRGGDGPVRRLIVQRTLICVLLVFSLTIGAMAPGSPASASDGPPHPAGTGGDTLPGTPAETMLPAASAREGREEGILAELESPSLIVVDVLTGKVLLERDADRPRFPASITKIMTMLVLLDALAAGQVTMDDEVRVSAEAAGWGGTQIFLAPGEVMSFRDLFKSVAVASANDASTALAEHTAGSVEEFVAAMNRRAAGLGMTNTVFQNPHGIDDGLELSQHHMSARDVAIASLELIRRYPRVLELTGIWMDKVRDPEAGQCCELVNTNMMVRHVDGVDGLKTGFTSRAGFGISLTKEQDGARFVAVVMGHETRVRRDEEALKLLNWAFSRWEPVPIITAGEPVMRLPVHKGTGSEVELLAARTLGVLVPRGRGDDITQKVTAETSLLAPVEKGQVLGRLEVTLNDEIIGAVDLVADEAVPRIGFAGLWLRLLRRAWPWR